VLKENMVVSVDGSTGEIFKGSVLSSNKKTSVASHHNGEEHKKLKTDTKVYVNLAEPQEAAKVSKMNVDGVGLLRAEFMIADIGTHPREFIKQKKQKHFIDMLTSRLSNFVEAFNPRPVIYRA